MTIEVSKMANKQLRLPSEIVKKDNELIRSKLNISNVYASRILASLIALINMEDTAFQESYSISARNCLPDTGGKSYKAIKNICKELAKAVAEIELPNPKATCADDALDVFFYPFFSKVVYSKGVITASFNTAMKPLLLDLRKSFTRYSLMEYLMLPSFYSQRIFEILKSWSGLPEATLSLQKLHHVLDTPPSFRADFRAFRIRVLEQAYKDIHEHTDLKFEWLPIKSGRSVESIKFIFSEARKAITVEEKQKAELDKQRRLNNQNMGLAVECCENKKGVCTSQDNKAVVCDLCVQFGMCASWVKRGGKPLASVSVQ